MTQDDIDAAATVLNVTRVDLGDERAVIRELHRSGIEYGAVLDVIDLAIDRARALRAESSSK